MQNVGLDEAQARIKIAGRNISNLWYANDTTLMAEWRRTKEPLDERGEWKSWLKLNIQKINHGMQSHHFIAHRWGNSGWLYFGGFQNHCRLWLSHEIKRHLLLGRQFMSNLDILKSRDITLPTKVHLVKANCCFLTCIQISQEAGQVDWYSHLLRIFHSLLW